MSFAAKSGERNLAAASFSRISRGMFVLGIVVVAAMLPACEAVAQYYYHPHPHHYWRVGYRYHGSTAYESFARGNAELIRSRAAANYVNAQALTELEQARAAHIENRVRLTSAYYQRKAMRDEYRNARRQVRIQRNALEPLAENEFNPATGEIHWPLLLQHADYDQFRDRMTQLHAQLASDGSLTAREVRESDDVSRAFRKQIASQRDGYDHESFRHANRFVLRLDKFRRDSAS